MLRHQPEGVSLKDFQTVTLTTKLRLTQCFGGYSLKEGVIAIGYFCVVAGLAGSLTYFSLGFVVMNEVFGTNNMTGSALVLSYLLCGAWSVFQTVTSAFLIYGCYKGRTSFLVPWVITASMSAFFAVLMVVMSCVGAAVMKHSVPLIDGAVQLFACGMTSYFVMVVRSYGVLLNEQWLFQTAVQERGTFLVCYE